MQTDNDTFATACEFTAPSQEEVKDLSQALLTPVNEQDQNDEEENDDEEKEENDDEEHPDHQSADRDEGTGVLDDDNDDNDDDKSVQEKKDPIHTLCKATHAELTNLGKALTCPICQSTYQNAVILPCVHAYCRNCIVQALRVKQECPTCKHAPCSKRSLVECPLLNEMAVAYKRITRAVGWSPSVYSQSVTMTQLPVGDGETTHLVDCHEQLQAAKTWQRAMDSSEENPILRDERAKVVQVNQTAIVQAAVKKRRSSSRGKSLESQKSVSFQAADSSSSIAQEDDETEEHKQQDAVEISEPTETEDTPKDRGDIDDDDDETVGPDPPTVNENKSQDKQSQDDQHRPDNVSTATVPMEIGDDDKEGGTQQEGEEAAIEEPQEDIPIANDDDDDDTVGPQQEEEESADVEQQPQDNTPMANDYDDDDDTVGPQEEEEKAAVEQHPQDNAPMENDDDDDTVGPQKDGEKAAVEQQPQDNDPMANDDDDDDDDNVGPQEEEKAAVEQQPQDNAPMANGDDDDDDTVKLQEKEASASVEQQQEEEDFVIANNDDDEDVDNEQPPAEARRDDGMTTTTGISVGAIVRVQSRTWPGINKPGGVARVAKVHPDSHSYDVAYVLGGTEKSVGAAHIVVVNDESSQSPQQRRRGNTGNELPVSVLQALARDGFDTARTKRKPAVASQKENKKKQGKTTPKSATTTIKKKATKRKEHAQDVIPTKKKSRKAPVEIVLPELDNEDKCKLANERYQKLIEAAMKDGIVHVVVSSLPEDVQAKLDVLVRDTKNQDGKFSFCQKQQVLYILDILIVRSTRSETQGLRGVQPKDDHFGNHACGKQRRPGSRKSENVEGHESITCRRPGRDN